MSKKYSVEDICKEYGTTFEEVRAIYKSTTVKDIVKDLLHGSHESFDKARPAVKAAVVIRQNR